MPEEDKVEMSTQPLSPESGPGRQSTVGGASQPARRAVGQLALILTVAVAGIVATQLLLYFQTGAWQPLLVVGSALLSLALMIAAYIQVRREHPLAAGYLMLVGVLVVYVGGELALSGATWFFLAGAYLLILLVGSIALRRKWGIWLVAAGLYTALVLLISWQEPLARYDVTQIGFLTTQLLLVTALLTLIALWQLVRALRGIGTIRTRLLVSFVLVVSLTALSVGAVSLAIGYRNSRDQVSNRLGLVTTFKGDQLDAWVDSLQNDLASLALEEGSATVATYARMVLTTPRQESDLGSSVVVFGDILRTRLREANAQTRRFDDMFVMDRDGIVLISTTVAQEGLDLSDQPYYATSLLRPCFQPPFQSPVSGQPAVVALQPISDQFGNVLGVLGGRVSLDPIRRILDQRAGLGETGVTYIAGPDYAVMPLSRLGDTERANLSSAGIDQALLSRGRGSDTYDDYRGVPVLGAYQWLIDFDGALLGEQSQAEAFAAVYRTLAISAGVAVFFVLLAVGASLLITRSIADPLGALADTATQIAGGNLERVARVERQDEIGTLAEAFNSMTAQLRDLIGGLEQRVADRTRELEQRSAYLEASAGVGQAISSLLESDALIRRVVELIAELFDMYYVGLFLVDESGESAVLRAGAGNTGRPLPAIGRKLILDGSSMISWSIANRRARIAQEASEDVVRVSAPELPATRSEAALPLQSRGQVIGALTVQHTEPDAFDQDTIVVLQTMADQVAAALVNARLFAERQQALTAAQRAYGELSREAWRDLLSARTGLGYRSGAGGISDARDVWRPEMEKALLEERMIQGDGPDDDGRIPLAVPIKVRGQIVGVLDTYKPSDAGGWTQEEIALVEDVVDQLDVALESARLHQDAQRQATREQTIRRATEQMRRRRDVESILQGTLAELTKALGVPRAYVRLGTEAELASSQTRAPRRAPETKPLEPDEDDDPA